MELNTVKMCIIIFSPCPAPLKDFEGLQVKDHVPQQ